MLKSLKVFIFVTLALTVSLLFYSLSSYAMSVPQLIIHFFSASIVTEQATLYRLDGTTPIYRLDGTTPIYILKEVTE